LLLVVREFEVIIFLLLLFLCLFFSCLDTYFVSNLFQDLGKVFQCLSVLFLVHSDSFDLRCKLKDLSFGGLNLLHANIKFLDISLNSLLHSFVVVSDIELQRLHNTLVLVSKVLF
jgi:hypothetical protein